MLYHLNIHEHNFTDFLMFFLYIWVINKFWKEGVKEVFWSFILDVFTIQLPHFNWPLELSFSSYTELDEFHFCKVKDLNSLRFFRNLSQNCFMSISLIFSSGFKSMAWLGHVNTLTFIAVLETIALLKKTIWYKVQFLK